MKRERLIEFMNCGLQGNELKSVIQRYAIKLWFETGANGFITGYTGFGKGYMIEQLLKRYKVKNTGQVNIVVPSTNLKKDIDRVVEDLEMQSFVDVYVINTYTMADDPTIKRDCEMLLIDEVHHICGEEAVYFNKVIEMTNANKTLGFSATLDSADIEKLESQGLNHVFDISLYEAKKLKLVIDYEVLNVGVSLEDYERKAYSELDAVFKDSLKFFYQVPDRVDTFKLAMGCSLGSAATVTITVNGEVKNTTCGKLLTYVSACLNVKEEIVKVKAIDFRRKMMARNAIITTAANKQKSLLAILNKSIHDWNYKTIVFGSGIEHIDKIQKLTHNAAIAYHSKISKKKREDIFDLFNSGVIKTLLTVSALNEGANVKDLELGITYRYDGKERKAIQQLGRLLRSDERNPNKKSFMVYLYCKPFLTTDSNGELKRIVPTDMNKLKTIQQTMSGVKYVNLEECLKILSKK